MATHQEIKKMKSAIDFEKMHPSFPPPGSPMKQQPIELAKPDPSYGTMLGDLYNN